LAQESANIGDEGFDPATTAKKKSLRFWMDTINNPPVLSFRSFAKVSGRKTETLLSQKKNEQEGF
jgi:hypothetical protein